MMLTKVRFVTEREPPFGACTSRVLTAGPALSCREWPSAGGALAPRLVTRWPCRWKVRTQARARL